MDPVLENYKVLNIIMENANIVWKEIAKQRKVSSSFPGQQLQAIYLVDIGKGPIESCEFLCKYATM